MYWLGLAAEPGGGGAPGGQPAAGLTRRRHQPPHRPRPCAQLAAVPARRLIPGSLLPCGSLLCIPVHERLPGAEVLPDNRPAAGLAGPWFIVMPRRTPLLDRRSGPRRGRRPGTAQRAGLPGRAEDGEYHAHRPPGGVAAGHPIRTLMPLAALLDPRATEGRLPRLLRSLALPASLGREHGDGGDERPADPHGGHVIPAAMRCPRHRWPWTAPPAVRR
jgi:hypothetical protein